MLTEKHIKNTLAVLIILLLAGSDSLFSAERESRKAAPSESKQSASSSQKSESREASSRSEQRTAAPAPPPAQRAAPAPAPKPQPAPSSSRSATRSSSSSSRSASPSVRSSSSRDRSGSSGFRITFGNRSTSSRSTDTHRTTPAPRDTSHSYRTPEPAYTNPTPDSGGSRTSSDYGRSYEPQYKYNYDYSRPTTQDTNDRYRGYSTRSYEPSPVIIRDRNGTREVYSGQSRESTVYTNPDLTGGRTGESRDTLSRSNRTLPDTSDRTSPDSSGMSDRTQSRLRRIVITPDSVTEYRGNEVISRSSKETRVITPTDNSKTLKSIETPQSGRTIVTDPARTSSGREGVEISRRSAIRDILSPRQDTSRDVSGLKRIELPNQGAGESRGGTRIITPETTLVQRPARETLLLQPGGTTKSSFFGASPLPAVTTSPGLTLQETQTVPTVSITGNNNVYINGDVNISSMYPYLPRHYSSPIRHLAYSFPHHRYPWHFNDYWYGTRYYGRSFFRIGFSCDDWSFGFGYSTYRPAYYGHVTYYSWGPHYGISYIYPSYHRKYVFFSIGGYWPRYYTYRRYYRYGCHPYRWYGCYPEPAPVVKEYNTYNYYYNYGGSSSYDSQPAYYGASVPQASYGYTASGEIVPDYDALSKVRERLQKINPPQQETLLPADEQFDRGVEAFEQQRFEDAVIYFREAIRLEPDDIVLPFAYCQALFAVEEYSQAATVLRTAVKMLPEDFETVFFPRGLYKDDQVLQDQIRRLMVTAEHEPFRDDLLLMLGYQLMGTMDYENARPVLNEAAKSEFNAATAATLLKVIDEAQKEN